MEDFDIFTNEIHFTKPMYKNTLNTLVYDGPSTPIASNYQAGRKLLALESLAENNEIEGAFHLSEAVSSSIRFMATYREEQRRLDGKKLEKMTICNKQIQEIVDSKPISKKDESLLATLSYDAEEVADTLKKVTIDEDLPFYERYLKFTKENNTDNFQRILKELPKEWTIIQITAPYNPNENLHSLSEFRTEIDSIYLSVFTNEYLDDDCGPFTVNIPANVTKGEVKPLFTELYSILEENYNTINNAQSLNNKRLVQNYWSRREDIDLRMKSLINAMEKEWLGGWGCLLTGKLIDNTVKGKIVRVVDDAISDWGFIKITKKQKIMLYNLIEASPNMTSQQTKTCIRRILTEHGNPQDIRQVLDPCDSCTKEFQLLNELCLKCLSKCFMAIHNFELVDGIKAFSQVATQIKDGDDWAMLKKAKRHPVILIVDEILDTFPWENLPILNQHPVTRIENVHFLYYLYKIHEKDIIDGHYQAKGREGRYVINPEKNLERMQHRMSSFVNYWCGEWSGTIGETPAPDTYLQYLTDSDMFLYCGHGDGWQVWSGGSRPVEGGRSRSVSLLSGCGSVRLQRAAPRQPCAGHHRRLHLAHSPAVIGMLWEVTDLEVDKMVTTLVSLCVPSTAPLPWAAVGKGKWSQGELVIPESSVKPAKQSREASLARAVSRARAATSYIMIASSLVVRGLPAAIV